MTGYTVHTGASKKFVAGWDQIFGEGKKKSSGQKSAKKKAAKKKPGAVKKKTGKKKPVKKKRSR